MRALASEIAKQPVTSEPERINAAIMANIARYYAGHKDYPIGYIDTWMGLSPFVVTQINGPLMDIPRTLESSHRISTPRDAEDYLVRLAAFDVMVASVQAKLAADAGRGWIAPKVILEGANDYIARFIAPEPASHALVTSFADKLAASDAFSAQERDAMMRRATGLVRDVVYPAYQQVTDAVRALLPKAPDADGIWAQPQGAGYYRDAIRFLGDTDLDADAIHDVGLAEIKRISGEMDAILRAEGYTEGTVAQRMVGLTGESRFLYPDTAEGRRELLDDLNGYIADITREMQPLFRTAPPYRVEVKAYPVEIQDGMPGGEYQSPSLDGSKPGTYWINLRDMNGVPKFALRTLTYHEANPGHHWQVALNLAQDDLPFLRRMSPYNAYAEGWALYAEQVAWELGVYEDDPYGNLGRLQDELFRAVRLVVDTGLHHKRWSREQAIAFMAEATGNAESSVVAEIERYMAWPGQALGYKLGMLKILALREKARAALGDDFDLAAFHDLVLLEGAMPMSVLEERVDNWVSESR